MRSTPISILRYATITMMSARFIRRGLHILTMASFSMLVGCSNSSESQQADIDGEHMIAPLPAAISALTYDKNNLRITVVLSDATGNSQTYPLNITRVDTNEVRGSLERSFPPGLYSLRMIYGVQHPSFGLLNLMELGPVNVSVTPGVNSIANFSDILPIYTDSDDDGFSNLSELDIINGTDPLDSLVFPGHTLRPPHSPKVTIESVDSADIPRYQITVAWTELATESAYTVYMDANPGISRDTRRSALYVIDGAATPYVHSQTITDNEPLYITVTDTQAGQESLESAEMFVNGRAFADTGNPPSLTAEAGIGEIKLSWEARTPVEATYTVHWSESPEFTNMQSIPNLTDTNFTHRYLKNGHMYYYYVSAGDSLGNSRTSIVGATPYGRLAGLPAEEIMLSRIDNADTTVTARIEIPPNPNIRDITVYTTTDPMVNTDNLAEHGGLTSPVEFPNMPTDRPTFFQLVLYDRYGRAGDESAVVSFDPRL